MASTETVRFTAAQRDALIDLAARLQAEHEATIGMDELARAAEAAGVDPRFLSEAARRLESSVPQTPLAAAPHLAAPHSAAPHPSEPLLALAGLAFFNVLFFGIAFRSWFFPLEGVTRLPLLAAAGFAFAWVFGRTRSLRWVAPIVPIAVWTAIGMAGVVLHLVNHGGWWYAFPQTILAGAVVQAFAAFVASCLRRDP